MNASSEVERVVVTSLEGARILSTSVIVERVYGMARITTSTSTANPHFCRLRAPAHRWGAFIFPSLLLTTALKRGILSV